MARAQIYARRISSTSLFALFAAASALLMSACGSSSDPGTSSSAGSTGQAGSAPAQAGSSGSPSGASGAGNSAGSSTGGSVAAAGSAGAGTAGSSGGAGGSGGSVGTAGSSATAGSGGSGGSGGATVDPTKLDKFSFFVTSLVAMRKLSKSQNGFGGDLRYGQADGLTGADKICSEIAESSMPGASAKKWHAFLSTVSPAVNAADRIGAGPWYDRNARLVAQTLADLLQDRPNGANAAIKQDLPNETGTPNHRPDPTQPEADDHHTLTGSNAQGKLYGPKATCLDWTSSLKDNVATGRPRIGFSWSIADRTNWISGQDEGGCGAGVAIEENPGSDPSNPIVGSGGGYGGIYCFALVP